MQAEIEGLRSSLLHLQDLLKGNYNKYKYEAGETEKEITRLNGEVERLNVALRKAEHEKAEAFKKLRKYEEKDKEKKDRSWS